MKKTILSARGLSKSFAHNGGQVHVISDANLDIYEGDYTVIMGASGSGKSTMLYALSGMDRATAGEVIFNGENITEMSERKLAKLRCTAFGFVFQQIHLVSNLTLFENVAVPGYLDKSRSVEEVDSFADSLLEKMNISDIKTQLPAQCSGGEQQRCAIARALINTPELVFADEPTGALDYVTGKQILALLQKTCRDRGMTVIVITHNLALTPMADKVIHIRNGKVEKIEINDQPLPVEQIEW